MEDLAYIIAALVLLYISYRWLSGNRVLETSGTSSASGSSNVNSAANLGFRPRNVTPEMIQTVLAMFPDIPEDNIRYDLLRTGNTERTVNTLLEKGFLPAPPSNYIRPTSSQPVLPLQTVPAGPSASTSKPRNLISRFHLEDRLQENSTFDAAGGKSKWEASPTDREASLAERKAQMVLAARKRLLEKQAKSGPVS